MRVDIFESGGESLEFIGEMPAKEAGEFVELIKKYGYEDKDGEQFKFDTASVEPFAFLVIYVLPKEEKE